MMLRNLVGISLTVALFSATAYGMEKSFNGISCKSDIPSALLGRYMPNERVIVIEARHKDIGLKDLGAYGMEFEGDQWTLISWLICGKEYLLLERGGIVRDVLASPLPQGSPQSQIASCRSDGRNLPGTAVTFVAVKDDKWPKVVKHAWLINDNKIKFIKVTGNEIICEP